jgi:nitrous oxidase accessory protein NosD
MNVPAVDRLWERLRRALADKGMLAPGNATPAEVARYADRLRGDREVTRFVAGYYYPRLYGGGAGELSDALAESLVDAIETARAAKKPPPPRADSVAAIVAGKQYATLAEAVERAERGQEILVQPGIYRQPLVIDKPVTLVGAGALGAVILEGSGETVLTLAGTGAAARRLVIRVPPRTEDAAAPPVPALQLMRGGTLVEDCEISGGGDGIWVQVAAEPIVRRCKLRDCGRYGVWVAQGGSGTFESCEIARAGAAGVRAIGNPHFLGCEIVGSRGDGAELSDGEAVFERCRLHGNAQCGIYVSGSGSSIFRQGRIYANQSAGVLIADQGHATLEKSGIDENQNSGVEMRGGALTMRGCGLLRNGHFGLLVGEDARALVEDCTVVENASSGIGVRAGAHCTIRRTHLNGNAEYGLWVAEKGGYELDRTSATDNKLENVKFDGAAAR